MVDDVIDGRVQSLGSQVFCFVMKDIDERDCVEISWIS